MQCDCGCAVAKAEGKLLIQRRKVAQQSLMRSSDIGGAVEIAPFLALTVSDAAPVEPEDGMAGLRQPMRQSLIKAMRPDPRLAASHDEQPSYTGVWRAIEGREQAIILA
jgi:hypothetical protein